MGGMCDTVLRDRDNKRERTMASTKKAKKNLTDEQLLEIWAKGCRRDVSVTQLQEAGWEAGQTGYITIDGVNYEKHEMRWLPGFENLPSELQSGFVLIEWDNDGNICC